MTTTSEHTLIQEKPEQSKIDDKPETENEKNKTTKHENSSMNSNLIKYICLFVLIVVVIALIIVTVYRTHKVQLENLGSLLETSRKEEALLRGRLKTLEQDKQSYIRKLNELNNELQNQYTPILPMTNNSYDAPDPDKPKERPKLLKDKEAIKAYVNSKRQTVQDELDDREAEKNENDNELIAKTQNEIIEQTKAERRDEKVDEIMEIIQSQ